MKESWQRLVVFFFFFQVMTAPRWKHSDLSEISDFLHIFELVYGFIFALQLYAVSFWFWVLLEFAYKIFFLIKKMIVVFITNSFSFRDVNQIRKMIQGIVVNLIWWFIVDELFTICLTGPYISIHFFRKRKKFLNS